ncbi:MAG: SprT-like domain-containing protein [Prevotella sp.]|nr:SprT-like domain-containing protein [Prevotella sp.]
MIATIPYMERKFGEFNKLMFDGKLPKIPIVLTDAKTFLGKCVYRQRMGRDGKPEYYDFKLRINTRVDLPENEVEDTLIHEMIHYYIALNRLEDASTHGPLFIHIMNSINKKYGRHLAVRFKGTAEQNEQLVDKKQHYHVVAVVKFHDGKTGIKVLPRVLTSILKYYNAVSTVKEVASIRLFMSNDIFFNRFPNSSALKVHFQEESEVMGHLKDAETLICDGKSIKRTR